MMRGERDEMGHKPSGHPVSGMSLTAGEAPGLSRGKNLVRNGLALLGAIIVNAVIFMFAFGLSARDGLGPVEEYHDAIALSRMERRVLPPPVEKKTPPKEEKLSPPKRLPQRKPEKKNRVMPKKLASPTLPVADFSMNPVLSKGMKIGAPAMNLQPIGTSVGENLRRIFQMGELDMMPRAIHRVSPVYPFAAKRRNIRGVVKVRFVVDREGVVREFEILEASPPGIFEESVTKALGRWRFKPGIHEGQAVDTRVTMPLEFSF